MFFGDDDGSSLACGCRDGGFIDRLDRVHVEDSSRDARIGQFGGRVEGDGDHQPVGDDRQVIAVSQLVGSADDELGVIFIDPRHCRPAESEVDGPVQFEHGLGGLGG